MKRLAVILILLFLLAGHAIAQIDVRNFGAMPDDDRDDTNAIQSAIDAARQGETINFPAGTFLISRPLDPRGFGRILQGATKLRWDGDRVVSDSQTILKATGNEFIIYFRGAEVTLQNLKFQGRAVFCDRPENAMVSGLVIDNCWFDLDVTGDRTNSIEFTTGLADSRITNCIFDPIRGDNGIYGYNWRNLTIANNRFLNGSEGIHLIAHWDPSENLLVEQNYFSGLRRMGVEIQGGGVNTVVQDNFYENPVMTATFSQNNDTFAYSIIADRSQGTRVRRNTSIAPQRPDGKGVRIIFELGGTDVACEDNYSVDGNHVAILNTSRDGKIVNNRFSGYLEGPSAYAGRAVNATVQNNGPDTGLMWDINRGHPGPNKRLSTTRPAAP